MIHGRHRLRLCVNIVTHRRYTSTSRWQPIKQLQDGKIETFRKEAFEPSLPALLPEGQFSNLPATQKWFTLPQDNVVGACLDHDYLSRFGNMLVPLEFAKGETFQRAHAPLQIFLEWTKFVTAETPERLYLAQASIATLSPGMIEDLPTPHIVADAGTGDIYDANIWMGMPPTHTPLHRDPNPNLFVQLAGQKIVRMMGKSFRSYRYPICGFS